MYSVQLPHNLMSEYPCMAWQGPSQDYLSVYMPHIFVRKGRDEKVQN